MVLQGEHMKSLSAVAVLSMLAAGSASAIPIPSNYTFTYDDPATFMLTGSFQGTLGPDGNTVTVDGPITATLTEQYGGPLAVKGATMTGPSGNAVFTSTGPAVATLDGSFMQFAACANSCGDGFGLFTGSGIAFETYGRTEPGLSAQYAQGDWKIADPPAVPEPSTFYLLFLGLSVLVWLSMRRHYLDTRRAPHA
jgi:hypothetical protein